MYEYGHGTVGWDQAAYDAAGVWTKGEAALPPFWAAPPGVDLNTVCVCRAPSLNAPLFLLL